MSGTRLYFRLLATALKSQMQYRTSFLLYSVGINREDDRGKEGSSPEQGDIVWTRRAAR